MPHTSSPYPAELPRQSVALVRAGRDPADLVRAFEPSAQAIRTWLARADRTGDRRQARAETRTAAEREEPIRLRRALRRLRLERDIPSNAAAGSARESGASRCEGTSSVAVF